VDVNLSSGLAELTVQDSGVGFDLSASQGGLGLISMRERLRMIGGQFTVESLQGKGTSIRAWVPLKVDAAADKVA
jgi:signal transduction histidine kinase